MYLNTIEGPNHWSAVMGDAPFRIRLNGIDQTDVRTVDTDEGYIERFVSYPVMTVKGRSRRYKIVGDAIATEFLFGRVEIIPDHKNEIVKGFFTDHNKYLNGVKLGYETEYLLTAPYSELMQRQKNHEARITVTDKRIVMPEHPYLSSPEYFDRIKELFDATDEEAKRQWLYGEWS